MYLCLCDWPPCCRNILGVGFLGLSGSGRGHNLRGPKTVRAVVQLQLCAERQSGDGRQGGFRKHQTAWLSALVLAVRQPRQIHCFGVQGLGRREVHRLQLCMQASVSSSLTWIVDAEATAFANELRMAQPLTTSNCAHENTADVLSATAAGIEIFPLNTSLNPKEANSWLFVRRQQREVWQAAFNASRDVVVTGSPGIGKSFSMSFLLRALMQANNTFVFEARRWNRAYLFKPHADGTYEVGSVDLEDWRPGACDELKDPANYYVIDPAAAGRGDICSVKAKTVVAPSPDPQHLGEWKKNINLQYLYMAACSLQEARCIVKCLRPELNENQVDERYRRFGGILRHLICHPEPVEKARNDTLSNQNLVRRIWTSGVIDMGNDLKPAHLLFQIVPKDDCTESRVEFVSEEAVDLTIKQFEDELLQFLTSFDKLQIAGLGVLYERFAHQVLCRGTLLLTRLANVTVPMFEMRLAPLDVEVVDGSGSDLFKAAIAGQPRYMRPRDEGLPVIDSCLAPVQDPNSMCSVKVSALMCSACVLCPWFFPHP